MRGLAVAVALLIPPTTATAQVADSTPCARIEARVYQELAQHRPGALEELVSCPERGTRVLMGLWADGHTPLEFLPVLSRVSQAFRTPAMFSILQSSATNLATRQPFRLAAMQGLIKFVDPREDLPTAKLGTIEPGSTLWLCVDCGRASLDSAYDPRLRLRAFGVFEQLTHDASPDVSRIATAVLQALAQIAPGDIPVSRATISGSFDCARHRMTLTNRSTVAWPLVLRQEDSPDSTRIAVPGTWGGGDGVSHLTVRSTAPITLSAGDRQILRLECTVGP